MHALSGGDKSAFDGIYGATDRAVYFVALSILREKSLAEDVMQSTYLAVLEHASEYRSGSAAAWIVSIARNKSLNLKAKRAREHSVDEQEKPETFGSSSFDESGLLIDLARGMLTEEEFQILMLVAAQGYKRREVSEILGIPIGTVTWKYREALKKLKKELSRDCPAREVGR